MKRTKVISLWHKWPARSVDKRRILMAKSLCLFASLCSFCVQVEKQNAHWIMQCHFMKNESTFLWNITNGIFRMFFFSLLELFLKEIKKTKISLRITSAQVQLHKCKLQANKTKHKEIIYIIKIVDLYSKVIWCRLFEVEKWIRAQCETNNGN